MTFDHQKLRRQRVNFKQINRFLEKAYKTLGTAEEIIKDDADSAFSLAL